MVSVTILTGRADPFRNTRPHFYFESSIVCLDLPVSKLLIYFRFVISTWFGMFVFDWNYIILLCILAVIFERVRVRKQFIMHMYLPHRSRLLVEQTVDPICFHSLLLMIQYDPDPETQKDSLFSS